MLFQRKVFQMNENNTSEFWASRIRELMTKEEFDQFAIFYDRCDYEFGDALAEEHTEMFPEQYSYRVGVKIEV